MAPIVGKKRRSKRQIRSRHRVTEKAEDEEYSNGGDTCQWL